MAELPGRRAARLFFRASIKQIYTQEVVSAKPFFGTGIGLTIDKKILEPHEGRIWMKSPPRKVRLFTSAFSGRNAMTAIRKGNYRPIEISTAEDNPQDIRLRIEALMKRKRRHNFHITKDGEDIHFSDPFNVLHVYASIITARKQFKQKLWESEMRQHYLASQLLTAQERERERISRDLHDDLGQSLMVLKFQFKAVALELPSDLSGVRNKIDAGIDSIDAIVESVRRLAKDLRPSILEDLGLYVALKNLFNNFSQHNDIKLSLKIEDIEDLFSSAGQLIIYRIFQEALTNIAKYAQATQVSIDIKRRKQDIVVTIKDNGRGFDVGRILAGDSSTGGLGLSAMEERANMLGGSLEIWSREGRGTKISLNVPFNR